MDWVHRVFDFLLDPGRYAFNSIMSCEQNIDSLKNEMVELRNIQKDIKIRVEAEEMEGMPRTNTVGGWLESVEELDTQVLEIEANYRRSFRCLADLPLNLLSIYLISEKSLTMKAEVARLRTMVPEADSKLTDDLAPDRFGEVQSAQTVGMEGMLNQLRRHVLEDDNNVGIIGVHGMGGVGKTALLSRFHNEFLIKEPSHQFRLVIMMDVPDADDHVERIQKIIVDRLKLKLLQGKTREETAAALLKALNRIRFVFILDNLWKHLDLSAVGVPIPTHGSRSKIIVASRIESICDSMDANKKIKVNCLTREQAWDLFRKKAGKHIDSVGIRSSAEEIANKCGGLPLALIAMGRFMASKKTVGEWLHAVTTLKTEPWQIPGMPTVLSNLQRSFDEISNDSCSENKCLRAYVLHCAMNNDGLEEYKRAIIRRCLCDGSIEDINDLDATYSKGDFYYGILQAKSLLMSPENPKNLKMHPMIRLMISWIGSECMQGKESNWMFHPGAGLAKPPDVAKWVRAERISLMKNKITQLPESPQCPSLSSLVLRGNDSLQKIPDGFFIYMPCLRVLNLSHTSITELPPALGHLVGLQYLDLQWTKITSLPEQMKELVNLRFFYLNFTWDLKTIPVGVIASLSALQILYMSNSYCGWKVGSSGDGVHVQELKGLERLQSLAISVGTIDVMEWLLHQSSWQSIKPCIIELSIRYCPGFATIQVPFAKVGKNMIYLEKIRLNDCEELEEVTVGITGDTGNPTSLPKLDSLMLDRVAKAKMVWNGGTIASLCRLYIYNCGGIEQLLISKDEGVEKDEGAIIVFPRLREMKLWSLPKFTSLNVGRRAMSFPCLEILQVKNCPMLKKLKLSAEKLKEVQGSKVWWSGVDESTKSAFQPFFHVLK